MHLCSFLVAWLQFSRMHFSFIFCCVPEQTSPPCLAGFSSLLIFLLFCVVPCDLQPNPEDRIWRHWMFVKMGTILTEFARTQDRRSTRLKVGQQCARLLSVVPMA